MFWRYLSINIFRKSILLKTIASLLQCIVSLSLIAASLLPQNPRPHGRGYQLSALERQINSTKPAAFRPREVAVVTHETPVAIAAMNVLRFDQYTAQMLKSNFNTINYECSLWPLLRAVHSCIPTFLPFTHDHSIHTLISTEIEQLELCAGVRRVCGATMISKHCWQQVSESKPAKETGCSCALRGTARQMMAMSPLFIKFKTNTFPSVRNTCCLVAAGK